MTLEEIVERLEAEHGAVLQNKTEFRGETSFTVEREKLVEVAGFCRDALDFDYLVDVTGIDHFETDPRFEVVYELYGMPHGNHLRLKVFAAEDDAVVPTVSHLWPTADWHEREVYDMFGIRFEGHPDLRRILMWEGYPFFPLRKDFPLEGEESLVEEVAFTKSAPLAGGPFVSVPCDKTVREREPRSRHAEE